MNKKTISDEELNCEQRLNALKEAEERLKLALEAAEMGAYERDFKTNKVTRSKTHLKLMGYDPENNEVDSPTPVKSILLEDREKLEHMVAESVKEHRDLEIPLRVVLPSGKLRWVFFKGRTTYDENGAPLRLHGVSQDITKCIEAEEQLKKQAEDLSEANERLEKYTSIVAHDLKTPLQSILLNAEMLILKNSLRAEPEKTDKRLEAIVNSSQRMASLIDDLLIQAKFDSKKSFYTEIDSNVVIEKVMLNLGAQIETSQAKVFVNNYLPVVSANSTEFGQLFQNIVSNSLKYRSENKPEVEICARELKHYWLFEVRDNGIGIDPKDKEKIFESFERLPGDQEIEGTGLGLSICKKIVENAGGKIWVESELGLGSKFNIAWPKYIDTSRFRKAHQMSN